MILENALLSKDNKDLLNAFKSKTGIMAPLTSGIFDETIKELKFPDAIELKKAKALLPKLLQQYDHLNYGEKKQHIYNALIRDGFDNDIALEVTKKVKAGPARDESNKLRRDFAIAVDEGMKKYKTEDGVKAYVFRSLSHKGYKLMDIKVLWENR